LQPKLFDFPSSEMNRIIRRLVPRLASLTALTRGMLGIRWREWWSQSGSNR
jgi:hypothetical protein